ncbi:hypothetical protein SDC9_102497 [bioreactor metagenome]|uniref:Uncharacterized protein n=1 Tax=bioreactor metagenome TaxID=1076179 RepID=A0A645ARH5_9ZZZZ
MRQSSSSAPTPGRRHQPARLSHTRSCSADRRRRLARSSSASNSARSSATSHDSRGPSRLSSAWRNWRTSLAPTSCAWLPKMRSICSMADCCTARARAAACSVSASEAPSTSSPCGVRRSKGSSHWPSSPAMQRISSVPTSVMQACNCTSTDVRVVDDVSDACSTVASAGRGRHASPSSVTNWPA